MSKRQTAAGHYRVQVRTTDSDFKVAGYRQTEAAAQALAQGLCEERGYGAVAAVQQRSHALGWRDLWPVWWG